MNQLTPYLCVADARAAIGWYVAALGAEVTYEPIVMDDGHGISRSPTSTPPPPASSAKERQWHEAPRTVRPPGGWLSSWILSVTAGS